MNTITEYKLHGLLLLIIMISVALSGCDSPKCCGIGCGVLDSSSNCNRSRPSPSEPFMGFREPNDIVVTPDGDYAVADQGALVHVDQLTGDRTIISDDNTGIGL